MDKDVDDLASSVIEILFWNPFKSPISDMYREEVDQVIQTKWLLARFPTR